MLYYDFLSREFLLSDGKAPTLFVVCRCADAGDCSAHVYIRALPRGDDDAVASHVAG